MHESDDFNSDKNPMDIDVRNPILLVELGNNLVGENPRSIGEASGNGKLAAVD